MKNNDKQKAQKNKLKLSTIKEIALLLNMTPQNIGISYVNKPQKENFTRVLDIGTWCIKNGLDEKMLPLLLEMLKVWQENTNSKEFKEFMKEIMNLDE